jgi:hypothetical protein
MVVLMFLLVVVGMMVVTIVVAKVVDIAIALVISRKQSGKRALEKIVC